MTEFDRIEPSGSSSATGFVRASTITVAGRATTLVISVGLAIVTARLLGPKGKGVYTLAMVLPNLISTVGDLGVSPSSVYHVARRRYPFGDVVGNNVVLGLVIGVAGAIIGFLVAAVWPGGHLFPGVPLYYIAVGLASMPGLMVTPYLYSALLGSQRYVEYNVAVTGNVATVAAAITVALTLVHSGPFGAVVATSLANTAFAFGFVVWLRRGLGTLQLRPLWPYWRDSFSYGGRAAAATALGFLNLRVDTVLLGAMLNPASVGIYGVGVALIERLSVLSESANAVLFSKVAAADGDQDASLTPIVVRTVLMLTSVVAAVICLVAPSLVRLLYSDRFLPTVGSLRILSIGVVMLGGADSLSQDIMGRGRPQLMIMCAGIGAVSNVILNIFLIPGWGIRGAATASAVSYTLTFLACLISYWRITGDGPIAVLAPRRGDIALYRHSLRRLRSAI